jgi:DNA replication licensing factor MCM7
LFTVTSFPLGTELINHADAFEEFLTGFKTSPEQTITTALGNITIGEDDLDEEDDFMDDDGQEGNRRQQAKERRAPQYKYKNMLQQLSDRTIDEATIDLDDLATV